MRFHPFVVLITFYIILTGSLQRVLSQEIPADIDIKFSTSINVSKNALFTENTGIVEFVFPMQEHLYKAIDALNKDITSFSIDDIKISAPQINSNLVISASLRMAYKSSEMSQPSPLLSVSSVTASGLKTGTYSIIKESGYLPFNATLFSDIKNPSSRKFNVVTFIVKMQISGPDVALANVEDIDFRVDLFAKAGTKVSL